MYLKASELILNKDGSIYHLNLKPEHLAKNIIFVGDQNRVELVTKHFDTIDFTTQKREFKTTTGSFKGKQFSVISTGIGADNIDIVLNELDALVNINFKTRQVKETLTSLNIVRIGTSGALQKNIPVNSFLVSSHGLDLNGLLNWYDCKLISNTTIENAFIKHTNWDNNISKPIIIANDNGLSKLLTSSKTHTGITATAGGFYAPQGRALRLPLKNTTLNDKIASFKFENQRITNLEMETSAIYGLSKLLNHKACSMNAILANRATGEFSNNPEKITHDLIEYTLNKLV